ncbi:MAG: SPOR domain-containing protein [Candidatus Hydrogenedentes bacterium]|nr:SPOR domain-containing protein [Candidatus Hydrogenedentota bacterium]
MNRCGGAMRACFALFALFVSFPLAAQQSPESPVPTPDVSSGVGRIILQSTPQDVGGTEYSGMPSGGTTPPSAVAPPVSSAVQTIRSATRRQVSVAGQQAFEPILQHEVESAELPDVGDVVTINATDAPKMVIEVLDQVAQASGWNIIASKGLEEESVRFWLKGMKPKQVMEVLRFNGIYYDYDLQSNCLYVMLEGEFLEREYGAPQEAEFAIKHADVVDMEVILSALMSQTGKLISDPRTGRIFVWDTASNLEAMTRAVEELDVPLEPSVFALKHLAAEDLLETIESLLSERGIAQADPRTNSIVVTDLPARQEQIGLMLEALDQKLETRTWTLSYADTETVSERLENILPEELGTITVDQDANQISVTAIPSRVEEIEEIIKAWDVKGRQVQIEAYLVSASTSVMRDLSIDWSYFDEISGVPFSLQTGNAKPDYTSGPESGQRANVGRRPYRAYLRDPVTGSRYEELSNTNGAEAGKPTGNYILDPDFRGNRVAVVLDYLDSTGELSVLSRPRVTVQDGQEAIFENTTDRPFQSIGFSNYGGVVTGDTTQDSVSSRVLPGSVQFVKVGTILKVKPRISDDGNILMDIEAEDSTAEDKTIISADLESTIPEKTQNKAETQVLIRDGQTIVIGGLRSVSLKDDVEKFPFLGDLPFVGRLFKSTTKDHSDRELAVFITPTIVDESTQPEAKRLAEFEEDASDTMRHSQKDIWGRTADRLTQGKNELSVSVGQSGALFSQGQIMTMDGLREKFAALKEAKVKPQVIVRVHPSASPEIADQIVGMATEAGLKTRRDLSRHPYVPDFGTMPPLMPSAPSGEAEEVPAPVTPTPAPGPAPAPEAVEGTTPEPAESPIVEQTLSAPPQPVEAAITQQKPAPALSVPPPEIIPPAVQPAPPDSVKYTVQIASFAAANTEIAKAYKETIDKTADFTVLLTPSPDGQTIRACVGSFDDLASANKMRETLSAIPEFKECFVRKPGE